MRINHTQVRAGVLAFLMVVANSMVLASDQSLRQRVEQLERQVKQLTNQINALRRDLRVANPAVQPTNGTDFPIESLKEQDAAVLDGVSFFGIRSWVIQVSEMDDRKMSGLRAQLEGTRTEIRLTNQRLEASLRRLREVSKKRPVMDLYQGEEVMKYIHPRAVIDQAKLDVANRQQEQRAAQVQMAGLQRRIAELSSDRQIMGRTREGRSVKLSESESVRPLSDRLRPGQWYRVSGVGNEDSGVLSITVQTVKRVASP